MHPSHFLRPDIETMKYPDLEALIDERIQYTVHYAAEHSPFYKKFFQEHNISPDDIKSHEDLLELPVISGQVIRENQPPVTSDFMFKSLDWKDIYTIHETSGTSGTPKSFFLSWMTGTACRKVCPHLCIQGFIAEDRMIIRAYGMKEQTP